ncbi:unnamed protein product, partial [Prorocentrum cordatum]
DNDQQRGPEADAREEANKKLAALRSRVRDLRAQAAEEGMELLGGAADRVQEEVRRLETQMEQSAPPCFTQAQVERERRKAETARDRINKRIEAFNAKAEDIQKELMAEKAKLEKKDAPIQQLEAKRSQLKQHAVPTDAEGRWGTAAHHLEQAEALLQERAKETADTDLEAKHKYIRAAPAKVKKRQQAVAEGMEKTSAEAEAQRSRPLSRKRGADSSSSLVAIPARASPEQVKQLFSNSCKAEQAERQRVVTANANTAESLERVLGLASTTAVVLGQELSMGVRARAADGGWGAGAAIAVPKHIAVSFSGGNLRSSWGASPPESPGRLAVAWAGIGESGGIIMGSCYLGHSEGPAPRNLAVLAAFGALVDAAGMQWVMGGDLDMDPEQLCQSGVAKRDAITRDYIFASRRLAQTDHATVEKDLVLSARCSPHFRVSRSTSCNLNCCRGFAGGDLARRQGHFQTEQFSEVTLAPARKPPRGAPTKRAATAEWLRDRLQELARLAAGAGGEQASSCHGWQKQLRLNKACQEVIDVDLLPLTAAEEDASGCGGIPANGGPKPARAVSAPRPRARRDGPAAGDWQNVEWAITNFGGASGALMDGAPYVGYWALMAGEAAEQERRAALARATKEWRQWVQVLKGWGEVWHSSAGGRAPWQERPPPREPTQAPLVPAKGIQRVVDMLGAVEDGAPWPPRQSDMLFYDGRKPEGGVPQLFCQAAAADSEGYVIALLGQAGQFWGLPACLRRVIPRVYGVAGGAVLGGAVAKGSRWWQGLVAGSVFAPVAFKWVLMKELDAAQLDSSLAELRLFFDGLSIARVGLQL